MLAQDPRTSVLLNIAGGQSVPIIDFLKPKLGSQPVQKRSLIVLISQKFTGTLSWNLQSCHLCSGKILCSVLARELLYLDSNFLPNFWIRTSSSLTLYQSSFVCTLNCLPMLCKVDFSFPPFGKGKWGLPDIQSPMFLRVPSPSCWNSKEGS